MGKNMKIMLTGVTALITGLFFSSSAIAEDATHNTNGRYQSVFNPPGGLWILDTHTGDVKICLVTDGTTPPSCTAWTKNPS